MLTIFNQVANLAAGMSAIAAGVKAANPGMTAEAQKQASLKIASAALDKTAAIVPTTDQFTIGSARQLLSAIYDDVQSAQPAGQAEPAAAPATAKVAGTAG